MTPKKTIPCGFLQEIPGFIPAFHTYRSSKLLNFLVPLATDVFGAQLRKLSFRLPTFVIPSRPLCQRVILQNLVSWLSKENGLCPKFRSKEQGRVGRTVFGVPSPMCVLCLNHFQSIPASVCVCMCDISHGATTSFATGPCALSRSNCSSSLTSGSSVALVVCGRFCFVCALQVQGRGIYYLQRLLSPMSKAHY